MSDTIPDPGDPIVGGVYTERIPVNRILAYSMEGGQVPEGVTVSGGEDISSRRIEDVRVREPGGDWQPLSCGRDICPPTNDCRVCR